MVAMRLRVNCNSFIYLFIFPLTGSDNKNKVIIQYSQHSPTLDIVKEYSILFDGGSAMD